MTKKRELMKMSRRRMLRSLANLGVGATTLQYLSRDALAKMGSEPKNEVPRVRGLVHTNPEEVAAGGKPKREPRFYSISREKWALVEAAKNAQEQIQNKPELQNTGIHVGVGTAVRGQHSQKVIEVRYPTETLPSGEQYSPEMSFDELQGHLPAAVTGVAGKGTDAARSIEDIPVVPKRVERTLEASFNSKYRPVPAGAQWGPEDGALCTTGTPAYDNDANEHRMVTAAHCFYNHGTEMHQPSVGASDSYIGTRDSSKIDFRHDPLFDAAVVNIDHSQSDVQYEFANYGGGYRGSIDGTVSETRLRDMEGTSSKIKKQGRTTGITEGTVEYVSDSAFETTANHDSGDSGGPHYEKFYDEYFNEYRYNIAGVHRGGTDSRAQATQIENIEDRFNVTV